VNGYKKTLDTTEIREERERKEEGCGVLNLNLFSRFPLYAKNRKMGKRQLELGGFGSSAAIIAAAISTAKDHPLD
jgi:hypothetical protein